MPPHIFAIIDLVLMMIHLIPVFQQANSGFELKPPTQKYGWELFFEPVRSYTLKGRGRSKPLWKTQNIMNANFIVSLIMAVLAMATQTFGLYLGTGGVVGKSITPRTGSSFPTR